MLSGPNRTVAFRTLEARHDVASSLDLAGRAHAEALGVEEERHHRLRMVCGAATPLVAVVAVEGGEVHLLQRVEDEEGEVVLGKPVGDRRREQVELVTLGGEEVVGHDVIVAIGPLQVVDLTRALPGTGVGTV